MLTSRLTPVLFLGGLLLAALLASVTRGHRRQLDIERTRAMHDSLHDALTGLPNRLLLADRFDQALLGSKRSGDSTGLLLVDLGRDCGRCSARRTRSPGSVGTSLPSCSLMSPILPPRSTSPASSW
jgi:hypothetical protein